MQAFFRNAELLLLILQGNSQISVFQIIFLPIDYWFQVFLIHDLRKFFKDYPTFSQLQSFHLRFIKAKVAFTQFLISEKHCLSSALKLLSQVSWFNLNELNSDCLTPFNDLTAYLLKCLKVYQFPISTQNLKFPLTRFILQSILRVKCFQFAVWAQLLLL